jgi:hypothetical protein
MFVFIGTARLMFWEREQCQDVNAEITILQVRVMG